MAEPRQALKLLYRDARIVAIDKPPGAMIHRSALDAGLSDPLLQRLRAQLGQRLWPVHRLDRPTSGLVVFALDREAARHLGQQFQTHTVDKRYLALVRGWPEEAGQVEHPLRDPDTGRVQDAASRWQRLGCVELPLAIGRYPSSRYALLEIQPLTGRQHQIRRHFKHLFHPLVGDTSYGEGRHNRHFRAHYGPPRLWLHAAALGLRHPDDDRSIWLRCPVDDHWRALCRALGWGAVIDAWERQAPPLGYSVRPVTGT